MPQMMPLNWLSLMFMFLLSFFLFNSLNYFIFLEKSKINKKMKSYIKVNWKW
uniref:ATP synthase F0 subunit 8 n=1 Tax=Chaetocnema confinis TaxID=1896592 RepID=UPI002237D950|nr:ATP synthase F0 subunit 8 [Chaetocnema confinis]UYC28910.1 ATP synthase F0 subunit 8 [Chaetocnema confinis]